MPPVKQDPNTVTATHALEHLAKVDKKLGKLIEAKEAFILKISHMQSTFEALAESIVYQQLTGKAAASIFNRLKVLTHETNFPTPDELLALPEATIRGVGLSQAKTLALIDLSRRTKEGLVPQVSELEKMSNEDILKTLTAIRGIGPWTVEMILIFRLGRLDVMPCTDYGVRKGFSLVYGMDELPTPKYLLNYAEKWRPYRTVASWYMWRALENPNGRSAKALKKEKDAKSKPVAAKVVTKKGVNAKVAAGKVVAKKDIAAKKPAAKAGVKKVAVKPIAAKSTSKKAVKTAATKKATTKKAAPKAKKAK
ncbi:MAG TPA: DNA-3-methyladenine glycosylase [Oculatellaceae cyanobacterium]